MKHHILPLTILVLFSITTTFAQQSVGRRSEVFAPDGKAIKGYDPVAYFTESKPVPGDPKIAYHYEGADWYFASEKNRDAFKADPVAYPPQYGGYGAFGASKGYKALTEADAWTIVDGNRTADAAVLELQHQSPHRVEQRPVRLHQKSRCELGEDQNHEITEAAL